MPNTSTSICNSALIKIGVERINSLTEDNVRAQLCNEQYDKIRKYLLRNHHWNFAIKRVELAKTTGTPAFGFDDEFQLPTDYVKILNTDDDDIRYVIEGDKVLTNRSTLKIKYVFDETDASKFDDMFVEALARKMAAELAWPLTQNRGLANDMKDEYNVLDLKDTRSADAQEGTPDDLGADLWLDSRVGGIARLTGKVIV